MGLMRKRRKRVLLGENILVCSHKPSSEKKGRKKNKCRQICHRSVLLLSIISSSSLFLPLSLSLSLFFPLILCFIHLFLSPLAIVKYYEQSRTYSYIIFFFFLRLESFELRSHSPHHSEGLMATFENKAFLINQMLPKIVNFSLLKWLLRIA